VGSLSDFQQQIVIGCILGDGYMRKKTNAHLQIAHSIKQKEYVDWKYRALKDLVLTPPKPYKGNGGRIGYRFFTRSLPQLTFYHDLFYINKLKVISNVLDLKPLTLAVWYMDDGTKSYRSMYLNTQKFDTKSQENLIISLSKIGIRSNLNRDKKYKRIRITTESARIFSELVKPYILKDLLYKIPI